ncbi:MAG: alpha/beta fold hydrolase [Tabrizicola sp.]|uniref:alpha/beta fold hydrolase n=1 Tax=Tabrizicola sp. TaxID=2005166 RepID=UPI002ABCC601|nr:alpha/beta fold hydrolase [Tabrizicola sp.]MDZ4087604.1 alpha/beta fold hydrolase [Tabrizicola sp.]
MIHNGTTYDLTGPEDAPVVALIHGLGLTRAVWQWLIPDLTKFRVLTYDLIGHGQSAPPEGDPTLKDLSDQLAQLLDHLNIDKAAVVGFSLGGMIARRFAQDYRDRTTALVILHSAHKRTEKQQAAILYRVAQAEAEGPEATVELALQRWYTDHAQATRPDLMDLTRHWVLSNRREVYVKLYRILANGVDEIVAPNPPISVPTLVLTGDEDHGNNPAMSIAIAEDIPRARLVILKGLRHMALAEDPAAVNRPVTDFLTEVLR